MQSSQQTNRGVTGLSQSRASNPSAAGCDCGCPCGGGCCCGGECAKPGASKVFFAGIYGEGGVLLGHVPICNRQAGYFEPVELDDFESAVLRDGSGL